MSVITSLFGSQAAAATTYSGLQLNKSVLGACIPIVYGMTRVGVNLIWYGDFAGPYTITSGGGGGLFGLFSGPGTTTNFYKVAADFGICEGPISGVNNVWVNKGATTLANLILTLFTGTYPQSSWGYLSSKHQNITELDTIPGSPYQVTVAFTGQPFTDGGVVDVNGNVYTAVGSSPAANQYSVNTATGFYTFNSANSGTGVYITYGASNQQPPNQALGYNGIAHCNGVITLDSSAQLPNINLEVEGVLYQSVGSLPDADPSQVVSDLLTNAHYGAAFPSSKIGSLSGSTGSYQNYCLAQSLLISPAYSTQQTAAQILNDIAIATNSAIVWNGGLLNFIPYGDSTISGNGKAFVPNLTPVFTLTTNDFVHDSGSIGASSGAVLPKEDPVAWNRKRPADRINSVKVEWLDRVNSYNTSIVEVKDQSLIDQFSLRQQTNATHLFCVGSYAYASAQLQLQRQSIMNRCSFALDARYCVLDPMDVIQVPDPSGNLVLVRVTDIQENDDDTFSIACEEILQGAGTVAANSTQGSYSNTPNYNAIPASVNTPLIWEPPVQLVSPPILPQNTPEIWIAASGGTAGVADPNWGGCIVNVSLDGGTTYNPIGQITSPCYQGSLQGSLASFGGTNPDNAHTPIINVAMSGVTLVSTSSVQASQGTNLCLIDNELFTFVTATLTGTNKYTLATLYRGLYGTTAASHTNGASFTELTPAILRYRFPIGMIGQTLKFKLQSFNLFGSGLQSLSACTAYSHEIFGSGLFGPVSQAISVSAGSLDEGLASSTVSQQDDEGIASDPYQIILDEGLASS
jgi:hypothetical protein